MTQVLKSDIDKSVNFVEESLTGFIESRYVRKCDDYFIAYLSSQTGCNRGCRFCHLTATKQTQFTDCNLDKYLEQVDTVFEHYRQEYHPAKYVHFNFMARGEVLANRHMLIHGDEYLVEMGKKARELDLSSKFNISTIMPLTMKKSLVEIFRYTSPTIYYSYYSANSDFRKKWLPAAMPVEQAFELLAEYQKVSKKIVKIHHAFIKGENDHNRDILELSDLIEKYKLRVEFNLVRYNPFSLDQGEESDRLEELMSMLNGWVDGKIQMIPRVGPDFKASCGMFVE